MSCRAGRPSPAKVERMGARPGPRPRWSALCFAVALAACSRTEAPSSQVDPPPADRTAALERRVREQGDELNQLRALLKEERAQRAAAEARLAEFPTNGATPLLTGTPQGVVIATNNPLGQILQAVSTVMTNPAAMRSVRENFGAWGRMQGHLYDDLLKGLELSDSQRREFERLLRQRRNAAMGARWLGEEEAKRMAEQAEEGLRALLGDRYGELDEYERQMPARQFAERFDIYLKDRNQAAMDPARKAQFIGALAELPGMSTDRPASRSEEGAGRPRDLGSLVDRQLDQTVESYDRIVVTAQPILTPAENQALDGFLGERMQEREIGATMTKAIVPALFGTNAVGGTPAPTPPATP